eukprot:TRINITY_DN4706_c0_g2_i1.p1 TRINITY_DN4706_c0_g2~~TRINITY_DN4706_c0_g2_i1.p1  ORF type:complete len:249 (+),score=29.05 TRINITY_DN4706_c0_g2_i1:103-849(+)
MFRCSRPLLRAHRRVYARHRISEWMYQRAIRAVKRSFQMSATVAKKVSLKALWMIETKLSIKWGLVTVWVFTFAGMLFCLPVVQFNLAAGAIAGPVLGSAVMTSSVVAGSAVDFLLARYFALSCDLESPVFTNSSLLTTQGALMTFLLRLCPIFPAGVVSYSLGTTPVDLKSYLVGTTLGQGVVIYLVSMLGYQLKKLAHEPHILRRTALRTTIFCTGGSILGLAVCAAVELTNRAGSEILDIPVAAA